MVVLLVFLLSLLAGFQVLISHFLVDAHCLRVQGEFWNNLASFLRPKKNCWFPVPDHV